MDSIETLKEKRRIAKNRLDMNIKLSKKEKADLEEYIASLDRGIECIQMVEEGDCQNGE